MANLGSLNSSPFFLSWIQSLESDSLDKALDKLQEETSASSDEGSDTKKKVKDEDILALMPPPPNINLATFQNITNNFGNFFGIDRASLDKAFGVTESAITLAAATAWAKSQSQENELVKEILSSKEKNPITATLSQYISNAQIVGLDALALQQILRQSHTVSTLFQGVDTNIALKAYQIAEQQIVLGMLDKWVEAEAIRTEKLRESMKIQDIKAHEIAHQLLNDYIKDSEINKDPLVQPALSVLVSGIVVGMTVANPLQSANSILGAAPTSLIDSIVNTDPILSSLQDPLETELRVLTSGLLTTATAWATPIAITLITKKGSNLLGDSKSIDKQAIRSFIMSFAAFLTNPHIDKLYTARIEKAQKKQGILPHDGTLILASLKASLLTHLLCILYKTELGGISFKEIQALINTQLSVDDSSALYVITKLLQEQLRLMAQTDPIVYQLFMDRFEDQYKDIWSSTELQLSSVIDPIRAFISLWDPELNHKITLTERG